MFHTVGALSRKGLIGMLSLALSSTLILSGSAAAQTTVVLNQLGSQVTDTTIRSGAYANTNFDRSVLITRRSSDPDWERRALVKFNTQTYLPSGAQIASAKLTLTVKSGLGSSGATRPIRVLRVPIGFLAEDATWRTRMNSSSWATPGGDVAEEVGSANASNVPGSKVVIDLTDMVQRAVDGDLDTRYTRLMLQDTASAAKESYREYYSAEESTASRRPTLTVVLASTASAPPPPSGTSKSIKVLQWNISQGYGQDGKSNIDRVVDFIVSKGADVVSFNEIMHYSSSSQPKLIADKLKARTGKTWTYKWVQKSGSSSGEGECVMTHLQIDAMDDFLLSASRSVAMARVNVNGRIVNIFSTHLDHQSSATRLSQVKQVVAYTDNHAEQRIIAGDFNGWPGTSEINEMLKTHKDGWAIAKSKGTAVSYSGNPDGNTRNTRIDYVFYSLGASALATTRAEVFDTRNSAGKKPSDHNPLIVTLQVQ
jgi:endonuclease/exonuclease/phosphatase family metal-dependent hydrolase